MAERRPFSEYTPLGEGFDVVLSDDDGNKADAVFDHDYGWMDVSDPENPIELRFTPTWFEVVPSRE